MHFNQPRYMLICVDTAPTANETTTHLLLECPELQILKRKLLPKIPNVHNTLYALGLTANIISLALAYKSAQTNNYA